ncbi:DUF6541 family protein [Planctomycetota bacterium]
MALLLLIAVLGLSFLPGFLATRLIFKGREEPEELIAATSFGLSLIAIASIQFVAFLTQGNPVLWDLGLYGGLVALLAAVVHRKRAWGGLRVSRATWGFLAFSLYCLLAQFLTPSYNAAGTADWVLYYPNAQVYLGQVGTEAFATDNRLEYLVYRTPYFSLLCSFHLAILGQSYPVMQIVCTGVTSWFYWIVLHLVRRFGSERAAPLALVLLPIMPMFMRQVGMPVPKLLGACLLMLAFLHYFRLLRDAREGGRRIWGSVLFAVFSVGAFMTHASMLFYLVWLAPYQVLLGIRERSWRPGLSASCMLGIAILLLAVPWYVWAVGTYGADVTFSAPESMRHGYSTLRAYLLSRVEMAVTTAVAPISLLSLIGSGDWSWLCWSEVVDRFANVLLRFYWETFLGGFTVSWAILFAVSLWTQRKESWPQLTRLLALTGLGGLTCLVVLVAADLQGHAFNLMAPLAIVLYIRLCCSASGLRPAVLLPFLVLGTVEYLLVRRLEYAVYLWDAGRFPYSYLFDSAKVYESGAFQVLTAAQVLAACAYLWAVVGARRSGT